MENLKGSTLIKITSIILIIFAIFTIVGNGLALVGKGDMILVADNKFIAIGQIIYGIIGIFSGQFGLKHAKHIDAAPGIASRGIILTVIGAIVLIGSFVLKSFSPYLAISIVIPVFLIIGGKLNK